MNTFKRNISFTSKVFDESKISSDSNGWEDAVIEKTAVFKEMNRTDRSQHKLHFKIISIFEHFGSKDGEEIKIDSDGVYELTVKAINTLLVTDSDFTEQDKAEFLNDSAAIFDFGFWLLGEKIAPFFSTFAKKSTK
jgi:hypothetical protein